MQSGQFAVQSVLLNQLTLSPLFILSRSRGFRGTKRSRRTSFPCCNWTYCKITHKSAGLLIASCHQKVTASVSQKTLQLSISPAEPPTGINNVICLSISLLLSYSFTCCALVPALASTPSPALSSCYHCYCCRFFFSLLLLFSSFPTLGFLHISVSFPATDIPNITETVLQQILAQCKSWLSSCFLTAIIDTQLA